jgi:hypothetical protein
MSRALKKCVVDTNVPITANLATQPDINSDIPDRCIAGCIHRVDRITKNGGLVLDEIGDIFSEYMTNLSLGNRKGFGNAFLKWVHDNQWNPERVDRVKITRSGESYDEFPEHEGLRKFDYSDRKFIAVSNAHSKKPPVLQATDSKWWGWKEALAEVGITVCFLCADYVEATYRKKMGE